MYAAALDRLGFHADEAIALEDSLNGIEAAKSAGIYCVGVPHELTCLLDLSSADVVVVSLDELPLGELLEEAGSHSS